MQGAAATIGALAGAALPVGEGVMDFKHVAQTLKAVGYSGFLSIEQDKWPGDMKETCKRYLAIMKEHLA